MPEIVEAIQKAAFIIADVSEPKPDVYYEIGGAQAIGKPMIVSTTQGTPLPSDIYDVPTIYQNNWKSLRDALKANIPKIAAKYGR